jgi:hypothetical protein
MKQPPFFLMLLLATALPAAHGSGGSHHARPVPAEDKPEPRASAEDEARLRSPDPVRPAA